MRACVPCYIYICDFTCLVRSRSECWLLYFCQTSLRSNALVTSLIVQNTQAAIILYSSWLFCKVSKLQMSVNHGYIGRSIASKVVWQILVVQEWVHVMCPSCLPALICSPFMRSRSLFTRIFTGYNRNLSQGREIFLVSYSYSATPQIYVSIACFTLKKFVEKNEVYILCSSGLMDAAKWLHLLNFLLGKGNCQLLAAISLFTS